MNIQEALDYGTSLLESKHIESPRLSVEILLSFITSLTRSQVLSRNTRLLSSPGR